MSIASEITRIQNAKSNLKTSINAKTDAQHQITSETIDEYADFVDSISGGGLDWKELGYNPAPQSIIDDYNYSKNIFDNWENETSLQEKFKNDNNLKYMPLVNTSNAENMSQMFSSCSGLIEVPLLDTSNVTNMSSMFSSCSKIKSIPPFNTSNVTNMSLLFNYCSELTDVPLLDTSKITNNARKNNMFINCYKLTDESLDNILQMCINMTSLTASSTKTLYSIGIQNKTYYPVSKIQALPHYQDFINAGWTTGY